MGAKKSRILKNFGNREIVSDGVGDTMNDDQVGPRGPSRITKDPITVSRSTLVHIFMQTPPSPKVVNRIMAEQDLDRLSFI